ncbi:MAG TPA: NAD-dependent epimerase/dehydratase family protein [Casimicrobiaceae bacterium]|nr:NAD-dependent epimerase/dehydratase family protein [Casimicrobiaceae bacterium]
MRIVVTGAAGRLARAVLPMLCADPAIARVTGIDRMPSAFRHAKFEPVVADIGDRAAHDRLRGADALVNLAFVVLRGRLRLREMQRSNVDGTKALLSAAHDAQIASIVQLSSAAVYGHGTRLAEDAPLAPLPRFRYALHKAEVDAWIARAIPGIAVLRPTVILGPNAQPLLKRIAAAPCHVRLPDPQPRLQCVHEDDVAQAVMLALMQRASGVYNLAAATDFSLRELVLARHPRAPGVPLAIARLALGFAWRTTGWGGEPGWLDGITRSLTLDCGRARAVLGWRPRHERWREIAGVIE